jgi:hypothetical protein
MTKPVTIRQHLVPFLFQELEGRESEYMSLKSKIITIYSYSTIGKFINYQMNKSNPETKTNAFTLYLAIEKKGPTNYMGSIYVSEKKTYTELLLTNEQNEEINDLLEDLFRISFCYYIDGALEHNPNTKLLKAIDNFIIKYDLLEAGFSRYTLKMLYYREKKKGKKLSRTQRHSANRFMNFS